MSPHKRKLCDDTYLERAGSNAVTPEASYAADKRLRTDEVRPACVFEALRTALFCSWNAECRFFSTCGLAEDPCQVAAARWHSMLQGISSFGESHGCRVPPARQCAPGKIPV